MKHRRKRILIVEDNMLLAKMIKFILVAEGFEATVTDDPDEAMELFRKDPPDLIISDIMLPKTDGMVLTKLVKALKDIPIILVTALAGAHHRRRGLEAGAADYITKPFDPQDLVLRVRNVLEENSAEST